MTALPVLEHLALPGAGVALHAVAAGPTDGELVLLLHGFPEFWYGWRHQIGPLAAAGFRVVALDQRGYNQSGKPPHVRDYAIDLLARDVVAVIDALGRRTAAAVGHDWGGGVAWWLGLHHADRVSRLAVLNCPHPYAMQAAIEGNVAQLARSWYMFAMQLPRFPEWSARKTGYRSLLQALRQTARPGVLSETDEAEYVRAWSVPGAMTGMVNWYRAAFQYRPRSVARRVSIPTLLLWGERDRFLLPSLARDSARLCDDVRFVPFPRATHWLQHDEPERVNELVIAFLKAGIRPR